MLTSALRDLSPPPLHLPWSLLAFGTLPHSSVAGGSSSSPCILISSSRPRLFLSLLRPAHRTTQRPQHRAGPPHLLRCHHAPHRGSAGTKPPRDSSRQPPRVHALHLQPPRVHGSMAMHTQPCIRTYTIGECYSKDNFLLRRKGQGENGQSIRPLMLLATSYDKASEAWTGLSPSTLELKRLAAYSRSSANLLAKLTFQEEIAPYRWEICDHMVFKKMNLTCLPNQLVFMATSDN
ncbi:hypothetical protein RIF29_39303 [Crotalaria pallida]|uniref:Uncharacterized protein n=1 Tax=Crotalaria pallida TaxID=3830 RepID=A0AAN9E6B7_CROPI